MQLLMSSTHKVCEYVHRDLEIRSYFSSDNYVIHVVPVLYALEREFSISLNVSRIAAFQLPLFGNSFKT